METVAIVELVKLAMFGFMSYAQQAGATAEQIDAAYKAAKEGMLARDPAQIPG